MVPVRNIIGIDQIKELIKTLKKIKIVEECLFQLESKCSS